MSGREARCTRISPSAILDDRLEGRDLDWARDHLRRCDVCRERIEGFQDMVMRVERLPSAALGGGALDDAFESVAPEAAAGRAAARLGRPLAPLSAGLAAGALADLGGHAAVPELANVPDLLAELEHEIFKGAPWDSAPGSTAVTPAAVPEPPVVEQPVAEPPATEFPAGMKAVPIDSHQESPAVQQPAFTWPVESVAAEPAIEPPAAHPPTPVEEVAVQSGAADEEPLLFEPDINETARGDGALRILVGLGAAACVLLAALLYETGWFPTHKTGAVAARHPSPAASVRVSALPSAPPPTAAPTPAASAPAAPVIAVLGDGATGDSVFRIRPGTSFSSYTRLVFDIRGGSGLPTMIITRPDPLHVVITFKNTTGAGLATNGIHTYQVAGVERPVQAGPDLVITVDLTRPERIVPFTLPAQGAYHPRLVVDIYSR